MSIIFSKVYGSSFSAINMLKLWVTIVFVISFIQSAVSRCPDGCSCAVPGLYDCSNRGLEIMFNETDEDVRSVDLSSNSITKTVILDGPTLTYLSLANNKLATLKYDTFDNLDELKTLILSNNSLDRITDDIFEWNPLKLQVLKLDGNMIEFIQHFLFYDLEELTELDMHNNHITFIHPHAFVQLKKLRKVRLDGNRLYTFDRKWFKGLKANMFTKIQMENNPWACDCSMKSQAAWLGAKENKWFNKLTRHSLTCHWPLSMRGHSIKSLAAGKDHLDCDAPDIVGISQNTSLHVNQSIELDCVVKNASERLPVPSIMWIAPNNDHYNLQTADRFEGIEVFQNGSIIIHRVQADDAGDYKCVASNNVSSVQATMHLTVHDSPKPASKGNFIDAKEASEVNDVEVKIDSKCPDKCTCVSQHVDCSADNPQDGMSEIKFHLFPDTTLTLNLASNRITSLPAVPKHQFKSLQEMRLDANLIEEIAEHAFDHVQTLQTLTLRDNKITILPGKLFRKLSKLTILVLDNNMLTEINDHTFSGLVKLQWLYIRNNLLSTVSDGAFLATSKLRFIHMEHNQLPVLSKATIKSLTEPQSGKSYIQKFFVENNRFYCDCNLEYLRAYLQQTSPSWDTLFGDGIICSYPPELGETELTSITQPLTNCTQTSDEDNFEVITATEEKKQSSGTMTALWFGGLAFGVILCIVLLFLWKRHGSKVGFRSMKYSNIPGYDDTEEHRSLSNASNGTEAFV